jgi:Icc-related predicted phosphoesterase
MNRPEKIKERFVFQSPVVTLFVGNTGGNGMKIIRIASPDLVIIGGDLTTAGSVAEAEEALNTRIPLIPRLLCVAGNLDLPEREALHARMGISLNGNDVAVDGTGFFGASASPFSPLHIPYEIAARLNTDYFLSAHQENAGIFE